jgi:cytochrome c oxidase cbb3-type subunit 1
VVRALGGALYLSGGLIMAYNLWMTVKAQPAKDAVNANDFVPAE